MQTNKLTARKLHYYLLMLWFMLTLIFVEPKMLKGWQVGIMYLVAVGSITCHFLAIHRKQDLFPETDE